MTPKLALAPMQEVTHLPFMTVLHRYGDPDVYFTEYFRVHIHSKPEKRILRSIDENPTGKPVFAQMIGQDPARLADTAKRLQDHAISGIDLNLGCPAPIVCTKQAGGGLLRDPAKIHAILEALCEACDCPFTVKTRVGFDSHEEFGALIEIFRQYPLAGLAIHGRTVREKYATPIRYDCIRHAVETLDCPVYANGNIISVRTADLTIRATAAAGLMVGRGAIRNPWLFAQIRHFLETGETQPMPTLADLRGYIEALYRETRDRASDERKHVTRMKRYLNFIGPGIGEGDAFLFEIRRAGSEIEFLQTCERHLASDELMPAEPPVSSVFAGIAS
ncbi:MAG: tRNA-dihydrouridine synthase B [Verrucomicrobiales bacterium]|jgi:tRNA-dihydrouridine synthase B